MEEYMNNFRIAAANLLNMEPNNPQQMLILSFNSTLPMAERAFALQFNNAQTFLTLDQYLDALLSIIPEYIRHSQTRHETKGFNTKTEPNLVEGPHEHHPTNKAVPTHDASWMSGAFVEGPGDTQDTNYDIANTFPDEMGTQKHKRTCHQPVFLEFREKHI